MSGGHPENHSPLKPYEEMLVGELHAGMAAYERTTGGLFASSFSAGMDLSFTVLLIATAHGLAENVGEVGRTFLLAGLYPVGFVFVILGRAELFTEQTTLAIVPVLHGRASLRSLSRLWAVVYSGNILGIGGLAAVFTVVGPEMGIVTAADFEHVAHKVTDHPSWIMVLSGALAGWLMGLLSWLLTASRDTISQILLVWLVGAVISLGEFHHSIVGAGEVLAGVLSGQDLTLADFGRFLLWATLGNILGAVVFAGLLKYSEGTRGARLKEMESQQQQKEEGKK